METASIVGKYVKTFTQLGQNGNLHNLKNLILWNEVSDEEKQAAEEVGLKIYTYQEVLEAGAAHPEQELIHPTKDSCFLLCYTSGTTGDPKGVMYTHYNMMVMVRESEDVMNTTSNDRFISYLPMAHIMEQCVLSITVTYGCKCGFYQGDPLKLTDDAKTLKPTIFVSVPRLFNKIFDKIQAQIATLPPNKQNLVNGAIETKTNNLRNKAQYTHVLYDTLVFKKFKAILGGEVKTMITGSAPIAKNVIEFFKIAFCCPMLEVYGQSETTGLATSTVARDPNSGTVGGPCAGVKIRLRDVPEMNYFTTDLPNPRGEI